MAEFTPAQAEQLAAEHFGLHVQAQPLPGEFDHNFQLIDPAGPRYILKIGPKDAAPAHLALQEALLTHLQPYALPAKVPEVLPARNGARLTIIRDREQAERPLRLLSWLPGQLWGRISHHPPQLLHSLGRAAGALTQALLPFDHPGAHRDLKWNLADADWIRAYRSLFEGEQAELIDHFLHLHRERVTPVSDTLRRSVVHNDHNDLNILVDDNDEMPTVCGLLDFGDAVYTHLINDLAIACTYAIMDKPDPVGAAARVVAGYHENCPLTETELAVLFPLIGMRLAVSVTVSRLNREAEPGNTYLQVSAAPAWRLLRKLKALPPDLPHYFFRAAARLSPHPHNPGFREWTRRHRPETAPVLKPAPQKTAHRRLDLSVGSLDLGHNRNFETNAAFERTIDRLLDGFPLGVGGYGEVRPFYTTDNYQVTGNEGPQWRTVHLGLDLWQKAGTPVCAPWEGEVFTVVDNAGERNYGPTIILRHRPADGPVFCTLYGHLSRDCLRALRPGQAIARGEQIAEIGPPPENGNWPPHLHFQIMLDPLGASGDFPGVAFPDERDVWLSLCPDPDLLIGLDLADQAPRRAAAAAILEKRRRYLGPSLSLSYREPLHMVRAYRQYLYAADGRRYLDTVNNVPHVGHQHERVLEAARRQQALLNTNTRYLHHNIVDYAEALAATLPDPLSVCYFVNSGSEANELALRIARTLTGRRDMVVLEVGYHGNTVAAAEVSAYKFNGKGGRGAEPHIHVVPLPDPYRGKFRGHTRATALRYAAQAETAIEHLRAAGRGVAAFIGESILSCGGQIVPPPGFLQEVYHQIRKAGGLCIADEVQTGLGRVGDAFWSFELQGVAPDIVTLGKPIGNGHPLGAVVTTPAIAKAFANGMEYFSTFGGNPVSCAIGHTVLQVVQEEGLQAQAREVGEYLKQQLRELQTRHPIIGEVRGAGLFLGVELVRDRESRTPAGAEAARLINRMRRHGILMSTDGPDNNVLKIKPPLCFTKENANFLAEMLDGLLG